MKELEEERSKVAAALKDQQRMKTLLEQKSIELKKNVLLTEELTDKVERFSQERDNIMAERNKLAMEQQTFLADKEVGARVCVCVCVSVCLCTCVACVHTYACMYMHVYMCAYIRSVYVCVHTHVCLYVCLCMHACVSLYEYITVLYTWMWMCVCSIRINSEILNVLLYICL